MLTSVAPNTYRCACGHGVKTIAHRTAPRTAPCNDLKRDLGLRSCDVTSTYVTAAPEQVTPYQPLPHGSPLAQLARAGADPVEVLRSFSAASSPADTPNAAIDRSTAAENKIPKNTAATVTERGTGGGAR